RAVGNRPLEVVAIEIRAAAIAVRQRQARVELERRVAVVDGLGESAVVEVGRRAIGVRQRALGIAANRLGILGNRAGIILVVQKLLGLLSMPIARGAPLAPEDA